MVDRLIPAHLISADADTWRRARLVVCFTLALVIWGPIFAVIYLWLGLPEFSVAVLVAATLGVANICLMRRTRSIAFSGHSTTTILFGVLAYLAIRSDGFNSPVISWFVVLPLLATMMMGYRAALVWLAVDLLMYGVLYLEAGAQWSVVIPVNFRQALIWGCSAVTGITIVIYSLAMIYERLKDNALDSIRASSRAKSEFLANMSHEIRTPLTAILGYTDLLLDSGEGENGRRRLEENVATIRRAGEHLLMVVNDILDLSKIEAGKLEVDLSECDLTQLLAEVAQLMSGRAEAKQLTFKVRLAGQIPCRVCTDATRLRQILLNLVGNAVKFTQHGGVELVVDVAIGDGPPQLQIDVLDSGLGMTAQQATQLFSPFTQADNSVTRRFGGTGLGLAICRRLASLMGGSIDLLHSAPSEGSVFRLWVPLNAVPTCDWTSSIACAKPAQLANTHSVNSANMPMLTGRRVLLAEDGKENQLLIAYYLRKAGADVEIADNGRIAQQMLDQADRDGQSFELLVTDMQMPEIDGYTLAKMLRGSGNSIPIVALTANAMSEDRNKCLAAGCDDYTTKPVNKAELLAKCSGLLRPLSKQIEIAELPV